ncbi:hypothetical protein Tco_0176536 [Tanacetum coccineum]
MKYAQPPSDANLKSPFDISDDEEVILDTPENEVGVQVQRESQTSSSSTNTNPLALVIHSNDEPEVEEPPTKKLSSQLNCLDQAHLRSLPLLQSTGLAKEKA